MFTESFMESSELYKKELSYTKNFDSDRYLFRIYNATRPEGHSANYICRDKEKTPYAVHCNCGKYHPVVLNINNPRDEYNAKMTKVEWTIEDKKLNDLIKKIKIMWVDQEVA